MNADDVNDWNRKVIEEFRANGGKVGGQFAAADNPRAPLRGEVGR